MVKAIFNHKICNMTAMAMHDKHAPCRCVSGSCVGVEVLGDII